MAFHANMTLSGSHLRGAALGLAVFGLLSGPAAAQSGLPAECKGAGLDAAGCILLYQNRVTETRKALNTALEEKRTGVNGETARLQMLLSSAQNALATARREGDGLRGTAQAAAQRAEDAEARLARVEAQRADLQARLVAADDALEAAQTARDAALAEQAAIAQSLADAQRINDETTQDHATLMQTLRTELIAAQTRQSVRDAQLDLLQDERDRMQGDLARTRADLAQTSTAEASARNNAAALADEVTQLETALGAASTDRDTAQEALAALTAAHKEQTAQLDHMTGARDRLLASQRQDRIQLVRQRANISALSRELETEEEARKAAVTQIEQQEAALGQAAQEAEEAGRRIVTLTRARDTLNVQLAQLGAALSEGKAQIEGLEADLATKADALDAADARIARLEEQHDAAEIREAELRDALTRSEDATQAVRAELAALSASQGEVAAAQADALEAQIKSLNDQIEALTGSLDEARIETESAQRTIAALETGQADAETHMQQLVAQHEADKAQLSAQLAERDDALETARAEVATLSGQLDETGQTLRAELAEASATLAAQKAALAQGEARVQALTEEMTASQAKLAQDGAALASADAAHAAAQSELDKLRRTTEAQSAELGQMRTSIAGLREERDGLLAEDRMQADLVATLKAQLSRSATLVAQADAARDNAEANAAAMAQQMAQLQQSHTTTMAEAAQLRDKLAGLPVVSASVASGAASLPALAPPPADKLCAPLTDANVRAALEARPGLFAGLTVLRRNRLIRDLAQGTDAQSAVAVSYPNRANSAQIRADAVAYLCDALPAACPGTAAAAACPKPTQTGASQ